MCLSTGGVPGFGGGVCSRGGCLVWVVPGPGGSAPGWKGTWSQGAGWSQGICSWGVPGPGGGVGIPACTEAERLLLRMVHILLECILVSL